MKVNESPTKIARLKSPQTSPTEKAEGDSLEWILPPGASSSKDQAGPRLEREEENEMVNSEGTSPAGIPEDCKLLTSPVNDKPAVEQNEEKKLMKKAVIDSEKEEKEKLHKVNKSPSKVRAMKENVLDVAPNRSLDSYPRFFFFFFFVHVFVF